MARVMVGGLCVCMGLALGFSCARREKEKPADMVLTAGQHLSADAGVSAALPQVEKKLDEDGLLAGLWVHRGRSEETHLSFQATDAAGKTVLANKALLACAASGPQDVFVPVDDALNPAERKALAGAEIIVLTAISGSGCLRPTLRAEALLQPR